MADLCLELLSEEIPARMQVAAVERLKACLYTALSDAGLTTERIDGYVTPRRLTVHVTGLPDQQPDRKIEQKGPRVGAPDHAIAGFLRSVGVTLDACEQREIPKKGMFWFYTATQAGQPARDVLGTCLPTALDAMTWPKSMRWGAGSPLRWVRPLCQIMCVLDGSVVPFTWHGFQSCDRTLGHRIMGSGPVIPHDFASYKDGLRSAGVMVDHAERRTCIADETRRLAAEKGLRVIDDPGLLQEVTGLVEWPVPLMGQIDATFMDLPPQVLIASIRANQKYLVLEDNKGQLAPYFIVVANGTTRDGGTAVINGNERVLRARLSDAQFFWHQDTRSPLTGFLPGLETMIFHQGLGTMKDKTERIAKLARDLSRYIPECDPDLADRAVRLAKADLTTQMVGEFPELQGVIGSCYARKDGEPDAVVAAIADHYKPQGPNDTCPTDPVSVAVAMADKLDTITAFWSIGKKPTGSKDPFALRRAALGVMRLILENNLTPLSLKDAITQAYETISGAGSSAPDHKDHGIDEIFRFFIDRFKVHMKETGYKHDRVAAVVDGYNHIFDLVCVQARLKALDACLDEPDGKDALAAFKRVSHFLKTEERKTGESYRCRIAEDNKELAAKRTARKSYLMEICDLMPDRIRLQENAEYLVEEDLCRFVLDIWNTIRSRGEGVGAWTMGPKLRQDISRLARLKDPLDRFFDGVQINTPEDDVRARRLLILGQIHDFFTSPIDFSKLDS